MIWRDCGIFEWGRTQNWGNGARLLCLLPEQATQLYRSNHIRITKSLCAAKHHTVGVPQIDECRIFVEFSTAHVQLLDLAGQLGTVAHHSSLTSALAWPWRELAQRQTACRSGRHCAPPAWSTWRRYDCWSCPDGPAERRGWACCAN